ncbi:MAG: hypothetical protein EPO19_04395 [Betaproteobacteria bacterium]|nr:MAG: hypothetical protein EPO19_04395 [Betaproteobacteria bacterium]
MRRRFNYIITIHNKEDLIEQVLMCVLICARDASHVYPVLDGCTDGTEKVIDRVIESFSGIPITKVYAPDVHELLSINAGLRAASQEGDGFNIILQDDVLLEDFLLEQKIAALYEWAGSRLGYISLRFGANFAKDAATSKVPVPLVEFAENAYAHFSDNSQIVMPGHFTYRHVPIKSPVCLPFKLVREIGLLEEKLAPYAHDDTEYALRCLSAGYRNGVFAIRFRSDLDWGGTRAKEHAPVSPMIERNMARVREWHAKELAAFAANGETTEVFEVVQLTSDSERKEALAAWESSYSDLVASYGWKRRIAGRIRYFIRTVFGY